MKTIPKLAAGDRVRLVRMHSDPYPIERGAAGTVTRVIEHDPPLPASRSEWLNGYPVKTGQPAPPIQTTVEMEWDNGRSLNLLLPADEIEVAR